METIVLVHGLWTNGFEMSLLAWRLRSRGFQTRRFHYRSVRQPIAANAARLHWFVERLPEEVVHFVGHSLGGLVILRTFADFPAQRPGRIVAIGSPFQGSWVAREMNHWSIGRRMLGHSRHAVQRGDPPGWHQDRGFGVIAGDRAIGLGRLFPGMPQPSDGTIALDETRLPGATEHLTLPWSHSSLLLAPGTARATCAFLRHGSFLPQTDAEPEWPL